MARTKQTGRRTAREVPLPLPCLSNYAALFRKTINCKSIGVVYVFGCQRWSRRMLIYVLHCVGTSSECKYYPRFVAAAFISVVVDDKIGEDGQGTFHLCVSFMGRTFNFSLARVAEARGLRNEGTTFRGGSNPHSEWSEFEKMDAARALRLDPASSGKYHVSRMTTTHRLLLYVISRILMPRKSNHGSATEEDLILLWAMINERQINWPYLMAHKLVEYSHGKVNSALGLPHLWGKVFPLIPLDVSQEEFVASKPEFAITSKNINQMRRDLDNPDGAEEDVPERNVRPRTDVGPSSQAPREAGESSQSLPSFMEMMLKSFEAEEMRMLWDRFLELVGEAPPTTEPTAEAPAETAPTADVPSADPPVADEATRTDDPAAEVTTEVAQVATDQAVVDSVETVQEQSVEAPVQD
ncbi:hypothetical protein PIB30_081717 [Stylosanthes scabra]|uniref:Uncharacterized protein n=1 Tax=Stylosanthes scabra TaxID=79078 RepID=A0ABU6UVI8_9FABA|nr:hypothetical protein [Stylosanthes scabra]